MNGDVKTFKEACCLQLGIPPEDFEQTVLLESLPPERLWAGRLLWRFDRALFAPDLNLIRLAAACTNIKTLVSHVNDDKFHRAETGLARKHLKIRLSGKRLVDFAGRFIPLR
jgi:hypothetical protein